MTWLKIDDRFPWHRKVRRLTDGAFRLHITAMTACAHDLTDGIVTRDDLDELPPMRGVDKHLAELVSRDLWHAHGHECGKCQQPPAGAWIVHDYLDFNPSKADVDAEREAARERQRRWKARRRGGPPPDEPPPDDGG